MLKLLRNLLLLIVLINVVSGYTYRRRHRQRQRQRQPRVEYCPEEYYYDYNRDAYFDQKTDDIVYNWDENDQYGDDTGVALRATIERTVEEPPNDEPEYDNGGDYDGDQGEDEDGDEPLPPNPPRTLVPTIETTPMPTTTETPKYIPKSVETVF